VKGHQEQLSATLDAKTAIQVDSKGKGKMVISFANKAELERISKRIQGED
jgi:hypothetical protein